MRHRRPSARDPGLVANDKTGDRPCMEGMNLKGRLQPVAVACLAASHGDEDNSGEADEVRSYVNHGWVQHGDRHEAKGDVADGRMRLGELS